MIAIAVLDAQTKANNPMIAYIRGKIVSRNPASVVLDTGGIGYQLQISVHTYSSMPESGRLPPVLLPLFS